MDVTKSTCYENVYSTQHLSYHELYQERIIDSFSVFPSLYNVKVLLQSPIYKTIGND